jgi:UDP-N-acetylmuramate dehydrogenase
MAMLVKRCTAEALTGFEFGISIPGTLGGAVWANAGAHGGEIRDVLVDAEAWDPESDEVRRLSNAECGFAYRESRFKHSAEVVLGATLRLAHGDPSEIAAAVDANQAQRRATQPLADQNAGSVFRNPPGDHAGRLVDAAGLKGRRLGSASVSTLHANFITADRGGRAADVRALGDLVRNVVAERFGVTLEYEIEFVGDWEGWPWPVDGA